MLVVLVVLSSLHCLNSTIPHVNDGKILTKKFGPQRYKKPNFFEGIGRGFYSMWRPVRNAVEFGKSITDYLEDLSENKQNEQHQEEGDDPSIDPSTGTWNDKSIPHIAQALSFLLETNISDLSTELASMADMSDEYPAAPWDTFIQAVLGWFIGIGISWLACLVMWLVVDGYFCIWCCWQCCIGCARCCNCCCRCCRNRKPICTFGCYDKNGPKKMWIKDSKIIWTLLTAGLLFGAIVAAVAAISIPTVLNKISGLSDDLIQLPPSVASRVMPPLMTTLPAALAPLSTIASDLDSDTLPLLNVWDQLFRLDRLLRADQFVIRLVHCLSSLFDLQSPYDNLGSLFELFKLPMLKTFQNFTFTADVVPCDTFEGEVTLTNIQVEDSIQSTLLSQFYNLDTLSLSMNDEKDSQGHPELIQKRIENIQWLNSYLGSASHASDITSAKSLLSTFQANVFSHKFLDDIMDTFEQTFKIGTTYTRTPESNKCFTDLTDFKNSFASVVPGPAAYAAVGPVVKRARDLAKILTYNTPWSRRELAKTVKQQIVPGNDGKTATFMLISDAELEQISILSDPSNFISFTSPSCNSLRDNIANIAQQIKHEYSAYDTTAFQRILDRRLRFSENYGTENRTKTKLNTLLGKVEDVTSSYVCLLKDDNYTSRLVAENMKDDGKLLRSRGRTLVWLQLAVILAYILMIVVNWTCPNDTCLCCQNLASSIYYIVIGASFLVFALLAIVLQHIQDVLYSDKAGVGLMPLVESFDLPDGLVRDCAIYVLQGPGYRSEENGRKEMPNPLGELLDVLLLGGMATNGVDGSLEKMFGDENGIVSPAFKAKLAPIEQELNTTLASFFFSVCDETDTEKGVFTYNNLGRSVYEIVDVIGLDVVNVLMMFFFSFSLASVLLIPQTVCTSVGRIHWPRYNRARDDPDYAERWDEEDRKEAMQRSTPNDAQLHQQGQPGEHGNEDWSGQPQQTEEMGEADKEEAGDDELPVAPTEEEDEEGDGTRLVKRRATNQNTTRGVLPTEEFSPPNPPDMKTSPRSITREKKLD
ncbi:hypothetical protein BLNAU_14615 [Blattamonas nauphoetae]|uniref:Uncharacterized protein n=1 Tax=Blattamonas nauphoetae TaxID=2049346 RepID=A0ABQ9XDB6_9EUKA|nr:hypothetical protein BLNAU_14615 [Blattamonas nauphoetae]